VLDRPHVEYVVVGRPQRELKAGTWVDEMPEGLPFDTSTEAPKGKRMQNLRSRFGDLDPTFSPAGFSGGSADLIGRAREHVVDGPTIRVAAPQDVISAKAAVNRLKDHALPEVNHLARRADRRMDDGNPANPSDRQPIDGGTLTECRGVGSCCRWQCRATCLSLR